MYRLFIIFSLLILSSCYKYKEKNRLAIPPIEKETLENIIDSRNKKKVKANNTIGEELKQNETNN